MYILFVYASFNLLTLLGYFSSNKSITIANRFLNNYSSEKLSSKSHKICSSNIMSLLLKAFIGIQSFIGERF
jgi:hypothetical protein